MGEFVRGDGKRENFIQIVSVVRNNKMIQKIGTLGDRKRWQVHSPRTQTSITNRKAVRQTKIRKERFYSPMDEIA